MNAVKMILPYPPSVNHYWRKWNNRMVISREGRAYRERVQALLATAGAGGGAGGDGDDPPDDGSLALAMDAFPPDRRRRDLDNIQKPLLDALEHAGVYGDDGQIDWLLTRRQVREPGGKVIVQVAALPLTRCPACHGFMQGGSAPCNLN